ncbi:MAG: hypothetical protein IT467_11200 [Dokdonella sp.]|nr:hypothetical protein [Dokdonella sp.]
MRGVRLGVLMLGLALMGSAQAGVGVAKFAVDSDKPAKPAAHKTPQGADCALGIAQVKALAGDRFEYAGKSHKLDELAKALDAANKPAAFDCVVIEASADSSPKQQKAVTAKLGKGSVKHVEWSGAQSAKPAPSKPAAQSKK